VSPLLAAVLLSLVSAVAYAAAAILQERLAVSLTTHGRRARLRALFASGRWWLALALQGAGALLHVVALGLGPLSVVQPLGVLTLVVAAPMAAVFVKRPVTGAGWRGILLTSGGLAGILLLTGASSGSTVVLDSGQQLALAAAVAAALVALAVTGVAGGRRNVRVRAVMLAAVAGIAYGAGSVYVKTAAESWDRLTLPGLLLLALVTTALAVTGLGASQASFRGAGLTAPLATTTVLNPVMAAMIGVLVLNEGFRYGTTGQLAAAAAGLVATWGLVRLSVDSTGRQSTGPVRVRPTAGAASYEPGSEGPHGRDVIPSPSLARAPAPTRTPVQQGVPLPPAIPGTQPPRLVAP